MAKILISTEGLSREEWLKQRLRGIGGSDACAAFGRDKFRSRLALWAEKTGRSPGRPDNGKMRLGRDLEGYVAARFAEETGKEVKELNAIYVHEKFDCIIANIDREIVGENAGLECKTTNAAFVKLPENAAELPDYYLFQIWHYLNVMGYDKMYLALLDFASGDMRIYEIPRDEEKCAELLKAELEFWNNYVLADIRPEPDGSDSSEEALKLLCKPIHEECRELFDFENTADELFEIREKIHGLESEERRLRQVLIGAMDGCSVGITEKYRLQLSAQNRTAVDPKLLKKNYPEIFEETARVSTSNVFKIARKE